MKENNPLVSAIVPTYKRREKLRRAVVSIEEQSHDNLEVIIVNGDPETDVTDITAANHPTEHVHHDRNYGISRARNDGIARANGEFVAFLDDDDEWKSEKIELQLAEFERLDDDYGMVYTGRDVRIRSEVTRRQVPTKYGEVYADLLYKNFVASETPVVRAEALSDVGGFDTELRFGEDFDLWLRIAQEYRIGVVSESLAIAHQGHPDRLSDDWERRYQSTVRLIEKHNDGFQANPTALGRRYRKLGFYALQLGRPSEARQYLLAGLQNDLDPASLAYLIVTMFPQVTKEPLLDLRRQIVLFGLHDGLSRWVCEHTKL